MHMMEGAPAPQLGGKVTNLTVMDVMLKWADMNISKPKTMACAENGQGNGGGNGNSQGNGGGNGNRQGQNQQ